MAQKKVHYTITDHEIVIENRYWNEDEDMTDTNGVIGAFTARRNQIFR